MNITWNDWVEETTHIKKMNKKNIDGYIIEETNETINDIVIKTDKFITPNKRTYIIKQTFKYFKPKNKKDWLLLPIEKQCWVE